MDYINAKQLIPTIWYVVDEKGGGVHGYSDPIGKGWGY